MLIRFTVENYKSFDKEAVFSMIPGKAQKHPNHIIESEQPHGVNVLKTALLYGANASGKSNLIQAMAFARDFIVDGVRPKRQISVTPFKLNNARRKEPSRFEFEFIVEGKAYAYGFIVDRERVHEEWLYAIDSSNDEALFERKAKDSIQKPFIFSKVLVIQSDESQYLDYVARSTRSNQLFLTKAAEDQIETLDKFYDWFQNVLAVVFPDSQHRMILTELVDDLEYRHALSRFLTEMNTGVVDVFASRISPSQIGFLQKQLSQLANRLNEDVDMSLDLSDGRRVMARLDPNSEVEMYGIKSKHQAAITNDAIFDITEESDGTQRLLDLFPILYNLLSTKLDHVFVIDELERSLHPNLVRKFLEQYLGSNSKRGQLIVTTHESTLLDLDLLRRDEIWFVEKDKNGNSDLYSLEEFKPRADLDIRKGYLHGRYGAIPIIGSSINFSGDVAHAA